LAERQIEPEGNLVDKIVHIAFGASVIVAREQASALAVKENPTCEMDGLDPRQIATGIKDRRREIDKPPYDSRRPPRKRPRFERAESSVLIGHVMILQLT
jgi:hypothetical protein